MGGLGKTTLAAVVTRSEAVREHYDRISFVSVGQEPDVRELLRSMHTQLAGQPMEDRATMAVIRESLQAAAGRQRWLVVLDDVWQPEHERELNFLDPSNAPEGRVFVTTRFAKMLPGYVEVALGVLSEDESVALLLGTAELDLTTATAAQTAAAKIITKMSGRLPLYLTLVGRLIFEWKDGHWESEVVAMLKEDRDSVVGSDALGSKIVGGSLSQVRDASAKELFAMMAVAPEDVPLPMAVLELVWCAGMGVAPPLGRIELMKLRRWTFELLDRNLVLGNTLSGVYMHDVVRDYCRASVGAERLRTHQRALVPLFQAATPDQGWDGWQAAGADGSNQALVSYVLESLQHHFAEAMLDDLAADTLALGWLETEDMFLAYDFTIRRAINAIGAVALSELAEAYEASGDAWRSAFLWGCRGLIDGTIHVAGVGPCFQDGAIALLTDSHPFMRCFAQMDKIADADCSPRQRSFELGLRLKLLAPNTDPRQGINWERQGPLIAAGIIEPVMMAPQLAVAIAVAAPGTVSSGAMTPASAGHHEIEAMQRDWIAKWSLSSRATRKALEPIARSDPHRIMLAVAFHIHHLAGVANAFSFPDLLDPGELYPADFCEWFMTHLDVVRDHDEVVKRDFVGVDASLWFAIDHVTLARHGRIGAVRDHIDRLTALLPKIMASPKTSMAGNQFPILKRTTGMHLDAGLRDCLARHYSAFGVSSNGFPDWAEASSVITILDAFGWGSVVAAGAGGALTLWGYKDRSLPGAYNAVVHPLKLAQFMCGVAGYTEGATRELLASFEPGDAMCVNDGSGAYELAAGHSWDGYQTACECEAREAIGMYSEAIEAAAVLGGRFPFAKASSLMWQAVAARCQSQLAGAGVASDEARTRFLAAIEDGHAHSVFFMELVVARDLALHEQRCQSWGGGQTPEAARLLQRAVRSMPGSQLDLAELLGQAGLAELLGH